MNSLIKAIENANTIGITGHVHPDGDCVGSTTALYFYISENYPEKKLYYFLEKIPTGVASIIDAPVIEDAKSFTEKLDLFVSLDSSSLDRLGDTIPVFLSAGHKFVVDHHKTNTNYGDETICVDEASSASEVLYELLDYDKISLKTAKSLYLGIVHDTGVFKYSATKKRTMEIAGSLLEKGVDSAEIIDGSFYAKSYNQNLLLSRALINSKLIHDGLVIYTVVTLDDLKEFNCTSADTEGIVEQLRLTRGVEIAVFVREEALNEYKFSLRSKNGLVDVSEISALNGGGGHSRAAGFTMHTDIETALSSVIKEIENRL